MKFRALIIGLFVTTLVAPSVMALNPGFEHFVVASVRGTGKNGSFWTTDLYAFNPNDFPVNVEIYWLWRNQDNSMAMPVEVTIPAATAVTVPDIIHSVFGQERAFGGFRIVGLNGIVAGSVYIYDMNGTHGPTGHTLEATPVEGAVFANPGEGRASSLPLTQIFGIEENANYRTNFLGLGIDAAGSTFDLKIFDATGAEVFSVDGVALMPWQPALWSLSDFGFTDLNGGFIQITMTSGAAIFSAAKTSNWSNDSQTLESWNLLGE